MPVDMVIGLNFDSGHKMKTLDFKIYLAAIIRKIRKILLPNFDEYGQRPPNLFLSPSQSINEQLQYTGRKLNFADSKMKPVRWQSAARKKLAQITGYTTVRPHPEVIKQSEINRLEDLIYKLSIYIRAEKFLDIPVHLVYKNSITEKAPVFIFLAGSTSGVHVGWGEAKVPIDHERISFGSDMLLRAARDGYLGVGIEQPCYGERLEKHLHKKSNNRTADAFGHLLLQGKTLVGLGASDVSSVLDWLTSEDCQFNVDQNRIYLFGHSSGGTLAQYCGGLDERIAGVVASGSVGPFSQTITQRGCLGFDGFVPDILNWFESSDIVALHAPRLFLAISGINDHIFPFKGAKQVVDEARVFFEAFDAASKIRAVDGFGGHRYYGQLSWEVFKKAVNNK